MSLEAAADLSRLSQLRGCEGFKGSEDNPTKRGSLVVDEASKERECIYCAV